MVINADEHDKAALDIRGNVIAYCEDYVYLGSIFTADGSAISSLQKHAEDKIKHLHKLIMFLHTNIDFPFYVKRKVVEAAFNAAIL